MTGTSSLPERADAAQRRLAEIWGTHGDTPDQAEVAAGAAETPVLAPQATALAVEATALAAEATVDAAEATVDAAETAALSAGGGGSEPTDAPGPAAPETIDALLQLASAQLEAGSTADAIRLLEQAVAAAESGDDSIEAAAPKAALAGAYLRVRRPERAIELYESLLAGESARFSRSDAPGYRIGLAKAHRAAGDASGAIARLEGLAGELEGAAGATDVLLETLLELATTHMVAGRPREAIALYDRALPLAIGLHGVDDRATFKVRLQLARAHQQSGAGAQAIGVQEQLVADAERALGSRDALTVQATAELALLLRAQ